jgi:hypothetical protein
MFDPDFDLSEWDFLPPLDDAELPDEPPLRSSEAEADVALDWDVAELDTVERIDALIEIDRQQCALEARKQQLLALIADRDSSARHWSIEEVGAAPRVPGGTARWLLAGAQQLTHRLPATFELLRAGGIGPGHAAAIVRGSWALPDELLPQLEQRVLPHAGEQSVTRLKQSVARAVLTLDPATAEQKHQRARADRSVRLASSDHGMAWLMALLPAAEAKALYARLDGAARMAPADDSRTLDQLRADALVNGVLQGIDGELPAEHGRQPHVEVLVSLNTLIGRDDDPAWLTGYGAISAEQARGLAHDPSGTWRRLLTDPVSGQILDYGTTRYRPPPHLADHVIARDGQCTFPFCDQVARQSDLDHVNPFPDGPTSAENLQALHRRHHNAKTEGGWSASRDGTTTEWTSPQGRRYRSRPPERWTPPDDC